MENKPEFIDIDYATGKPFENAVEIIGEHGTAEPPAQPSSDPAAQREAAAAPAEPAAGPETSTPPRAMTKEEAAVRLCGLAAGTDDPATLRALLLGCKALCREGLHKRRNKASRAARGL